MERYSSAAVLFKRGQDLIPEAGMPLSHLQGTPGTVRPIGLTELLAGGGGGSFHERNPLAESVQPRNPRTQQSLQVKYSCVCVINTCEYACVDSACK